MSFLATLFPAIIDVEGRKAIIAHQYVPGIKSITMPYLNYWWEIAVNFLPMDLAPNVVTLIAFMQGMAAFYVYMYFEPNFEGTYDSKALYLYQAFSLFIYQTLDAIDGKQARRTKNSSPLGQLFDHGCDAVFCLPGMLAPASMLQIGSGSLCLYVIITGQWVFYALNWQARHTGQFDFGSFSVDEIQLLGMLCYTITAFYGTAFWRDTTVFGLHPYFILGVTLSGAVLYNVVKANLKVKWHYDAQKTQTNKVNKRFYRERFYELGNLLVFDISLIAWNSLSVLERYPTKFITVSAFVFGHLVHRLIICDVSKMKSRKVQYIILPFVLVGLLSICEAYLDQKWIENVSMKDPLVINCLLLYSLYVMLNYAIRCMLQISDILDIRIFVINPPKNK